jgi:hypothetical protein
VKKRKAAILDTNLYKGIHMNDDFVLNYYKLYDSHYLRTEHFPWGNNDDLIEVCRVGLIFPINDALEVAEND